MNNSKTMIQVMLTVFFLVSLVLPGSTRDRNFSMSNVYPIGSGHSYIGFQVKYMGYAKVRGRF